MSQADAAANVIELTDLKPKWLDKNSCELRKKPDINIRSPHPWAVMLNDNVYIKDADYVRYIGERVWQYSVKENIWSPYSQPNLNGFTNFTLTTYQSQLACIGGSMLSDDGKLIASKHIFILNEDSEWKDDIVPPIPENENVPFRDGVSASNDGIHLFLAWQEEKKTQILHYDGQGKWERKLGSDCKSNESHIEISIIEGVIFLTEYSEYMSTVIYKASVTSFHSGVADLPEHFGKVWEEISWASGLHTKPLRFFSNLIVCGENRIVFLCPLISRKDTTAALFRLYVINDSVYWNKVSCLGIEWLPTTSPSIFSLSDGTLMVMGYIQDQNTESKIRVLKS